MSETWGSASNYNTESEQIYSPTIGKPEYQPEHRLTLFFFPIMLVKPSIYVWRRLPRSAGSQVLQYVA